MLTNKIKILKIYKLVSFVLIGFLFCDFLNNTYVFIWQFYHNGFAPLYGTWLGYTLVDTILLILLFKNRTRFLGLVFFTLYILYALFFLVQTSSANPKDWITAGHFSIFLIVLIWWASLFFCLTGLFTSLRLWSLKIN